MHYYLVAAIQQISFYPQCPEAKTYSCSSSVHANTAFAVHPL